MAFTFVKAGGIYKSVVGVKVKKAGAYVDLAGNAQVKVGGNYQGITVLIPAAPFNIDPPVIFGNTVLAITPGVWTGVPAPTLTYQWQRDSVDIPGATGITYTVQNADKGHDIAVVETATNTQGTADKASNVISVPAGGFSSGFDGGFN